MSFLSRLLNSGPRNHPTMFKSYNDRDLYGLFRKEVWSGLNEENRRQLLQETVNRAASSMGGNGSCEVRFADLSPRENGKQSGDVILLNRQYFANDKRELNYGGHLISEDFPHSNYMALQTALHENLHDWQNQVIEGTIQIPDKSLRDEYCANNFTESEIIDANGIKREGSHYLNGMTDDYGYYLYYLQSTERDAHKYSELQAEAIMNQNLHNFGPDNSAEEFKEEIKMNGYEATLENAKEAFGNENIEKEINNTLKNHYYGTSDAVNPTIEKIVNNEMAESYDNQHQDGREKKGDLNENSGLVDNNTSYNRRESGDWETRPEQHDALDAETIGEKASAINEYKERWENFAEEMKQSPAELDEDSAKLSDLETAGLYDADDIQTNNLEDYNSVNESSDGQSETEKEQISDLAETNNGDESVGEQNDNQEEQASDLAEANNGDESVGDQSDNQEEQASDLAGSELSNESDSIGNDEEEDQSYSY